MGEMVADVASGVNVRVDDSSFRCETDAMPKVPTLREELTAAWLADRLSVLGECRISSLKFEEMTGHNPDLSQLFRVRIDYTTRTPEQPDSVIVKIPPVDDEIRIREAKLGPYVAELGSYRLLEPYWGTSVARMYSALEDPDESTVCFVFEDLGSFPAGQKYARVDPEVARATLDFMASYHARFWGDDSLVMRSWLRPADWANLFNQDPLEAAVGWQVIRKDDLFEKEGGLVIAGEYLGSKLEILAVAMRSRPNTLTHNDFHQGNILLRETERGQMPVIIDWQLPAYAGGTNDLAKFLMTAVPFDTLAEHEQGLVTHYADALQANGVSGYSVDECWRDYRRAQVMVFGNYSINSTERTADGSLIHSSGDSTLAVIRALTLADPVELAGFLP
ncbi:MAG: phosphotransferase [Chloroflexi bacterium]|nr:phosphotransferase [Chloroflexota bacterium]